ncbi:hypothetical protein [Mucilaginibacter antarcticus]|uniref:hypothetical protein n=1 Tax=Mucilaginibacter antarcticus TaxID=1855725 RepID=UPI00362B884F
MEIKDYSLAMRDLNEVYKISQRIKSPKDESNVQQSYVLLYTHMKNYKKADIAAKRHDFIEDSLLNVEKIALVKTQDTLQVKKSITYQQKTYKSQLKQKDSLIVMLICAVGVLCIAVFVYFVFKRKKRKK